MQEDTKSTNAATQWKAPARPEPRVLIDLGGKDEGLDEQLIAVSWVVAEMIADYPAEHHRSVVSDFHQELMINVADYVKHDMGGADGALTNRPAQDFQAGPAVPRYIRFSIESHEIDGQQTIVGLSAEIVDGPAWNGKLLARDVSEAFNPGDYPISGFAFDFQFTVPETFEGIEPVFSEFRAYGLFPAVVSIACQRLKLP